VVFLPFEMPTEEEFIEQWPLYTRADIIDFDPPKSISRRCNGECKKETTWTLRKRSWVQTENDLDFWYATYLCELCRENNLVVIYRKLDHRRDPKFGPAPAGYYSVNEWRHEAVQKVGQIPAPSIDIPAGLEKRLGSTAVYYKHGLVCRNQNFGIAAVAYMRRVIEEKTDELIDVVVELAKTYGVETKIIEALEDAKNQIQYEQKVRVAAEVIPDALRPAGVNPLGQLYQHLSIGVHGKTDDECVAIFDDLKQDFEYVFRNLYVQAREAKEFAQRAKQRAGKQT